MTQTATKQEKGRLTAAEILKLYEEFSSETRALTQQPPELKQKLAQLEGRHERFRSERDAQVALGENEKAEVLKGELDKMQQEIDNIRRRLSALQPGPQALVASASGSRLNNIAAQIVTSAAAIQEQLEADARHAMGNGLREHKQAYLEWIDNVNAKFYQLWEICRVGLLAQRFLPADKRICRRPRLIPPNQGDFAIDDAECAKHFRLYSKVFLPEES